MFIYIHITFIYIASFNGIYFHFSWVKLNSWIIGSYGWCMFNFLRNCQTVL